MPKAHTIERGGPGQSGAAAGIARFDDAKPGEQSYPSASFPSGSRSRFDKGEQTAPIDVPSEPDERLRSDVLSALRASQIDVSTLEVIVSGSSVTLIGTVPDGPSLSLAEDTVERMPGVDEVDNQILVTER
jgi:hypothetical protein